MHTRRKSRITSPQAKQPSCRMKEGLTEEVRLETKRVSTEEERLEAQRGK